MTKEEFFIRKDERATVIKEITELLPTGDTIQFSEIIHLLYKVLLEEKKEEK